MTWAPVTPRRGVGGVARSTSAVGDFALISAIVRYGPYIGHLRIQYLTGLAPCLLLRPPFIPAWTGAVRARPAPRARRRAPRCRFDGSARRGTAAPSTAGG